MDVVLVGGGCGSAPLLEIGREYKKRNSNILFYIGVKSKNYSFDIDKFQEVGNVKISTEDGSLGFKGKINELLYHELIAGNISRDSFFINSGPELMVKSCFSLETKYVEKHNIWGSITYVTSCGVGICGKCSTPKGFLSCIDGPFLPMDELI